MVPGGDTGTFLWYRQLSSEERHRIEMGQKATISEWDIQALIDGELSAAEEAYVLQAISDNPAMQDRYNVLKKQRQLLQLWWKDH